MALFPYKYSWVNLHNLSSLICMCIGSYKSAVYFLFIFNLPDVKKFQHPHHREIQRCCQCYKGHCWKKSNAEICSGDMAIREYWSGCFGFQIVCNWHCSLVHIGSRSQALCLTVGVCIYALVIWLWELNSSEKWGACGCVLREGGCL